MIHLKNVSKYYEVNGEKKFIFKDVSLSIPTGKNLGILGRNGAGKSTFLRMLGGIDFPNYGKIEADVNFSWPVGLSGGFQGSLSGRENAKFVCRFYGKEKNEVEKALSFIKNFSELDRYFDMPIKTYSSGMRSRLSFSLSMAFNFECYLIDEVLSVGDKDFRKKCADKIDELRQKSSILLVNHGMGPLKKMCDSGVLLDNGQLFYYENINDAIDAYQKV